MMSAAARLSRLARLQRRCHVLLDGGSADPMSRRVDLAIILLVLASVTAVVLQTDRTLAARYWRWFDAIEVVAVTVFTLEYALRLWAAPMHTRYAGLSPARARLAYVRSPQALIDLAAILPAYASLVSLPDLRVLLILRLARFFKLARYSPGIRSLASALHSERRALLASAVTLLGLVLISASAMHVAEAEAQPERFGSIPAAMWWAIVTLTTVGYGDVVPVTAIGRMIAGLTMIAGLMMIALPIGIVATAFSEDIHRREFVVTWGMIARVPLFSRLDASEIAEIMRYLRALTVPAGALIVRRGEQADSMYFVAEGSVELELDAHRHVTLSHGAFFGEVALLRQSRRVATVRARERTKLLALDAADLQAVIDRNPTLARRLESALRDYAPDAVGDMLAEEVAPPPTE